MSTKHRSKQLIKDAIMDNDFLKHIDSLQIRELVESMFSREFSTGDYVIREGEAGAHLFVSAEGEFEVIKNGTSLGKIGPGKAFGELAILYNCTRTATIRGESILSLIHFEAFIHVKHQKKYIQHLPIHACGCSIVEFSNIL